MSLIILAVLAIAIYAWLKAKKTKRRPASAKHCLHAAATTIIYIDPSKK